MLKAHRSFLIVFLVFLVHLNWAQAASRCVGLFEKTEQGSSIFLTSNSEKVAFRTEGNLKSKKVFLFLSGLDRNMSEWDAVLALMKKNDPEANYVRVDLFGQGETADMTPLTTIPYSKQVQLVGELVNKLKLEGKEITLISHSYGGAIAARFVQENPGLIRHNIMIAPFVDFLETYTPGASSFISAAKSFSYAFGFKAFYEYAVQFNATIGAMITWPSYQLLKQSPAKLNNVISMTNGVRDVAISNAVAQAGTTITSVIYSGLDELIQTQAHINLWRHVPEESRGSFIGIPATHESVTSYPQLVFETLRKIIQENFGDSQKTE